ncbi:long-chain fatty acid--CoA ligase [Sandaracinobacter neustonicus]|uniref:Long-chain fatty acid--CoA ligase n=1 Tax=Sandaracinobacter neustonicus TaxID=1715348 RepID=A0A501XMJ9_9SPHN|nr:AMP-binding protein [Sandaracinobacter neustonicus]TPE61367.1 long-chain fatty acid--CoA ligase [Sandaracinobacter neustonicus]
MAVPVGSGGMSDAPLLPRISDYAALHARSRPDAIALTLGPQRVSYAALNAEVDALAKALLAADVGKGDRVATLQAPCPDFFIAYLATVSIGAIWLGLNPRYRLMELERTVRDAQPRVLLARAELGGRGYAGEIAALAGLPGVERTACWGANPPGTLPMADFLARGEGIDAATLNAARSACGGDDPCLMVYTSGSTGEPKGALLTHAQIVEFCRIQNRLWPTEPLSVQNFLPINHIGCVVDLGTPCLLAGGTIHFMEQFDAAEALRMVETERLTLWGSVPSVLALIMALPAFERTDFSSVQLIVWEGAAMPDDLLERLLRIGPPLATNYGMTETTSAITILQPTRDRELLLRSSGRATPGVDIRIADAADNALPDGEPGEVQTRSALNTPGYWNRPEATAAAFTADGYFRTGDIAVRGADGHVRIVGRLKEMYKSGGYNVYPREVEMAIEAHPAVSLAAVVPVADPLWQEVGVAFVLPNPGMALAADELDRWCRERLANYKCPKRFEITTDIPLLPIGKVDRVALKARASASS